MSYNALGKLRESVKAFKKALSIEPNDAEAYNSMGVALNEHSQLDDAIKAYKKAIAIKPDYVEAYNNLGNVLQQAGKLEEAIEGYNKALSIKPDYAAAYNNLGNALQSQGKLDQALEAYEHAFALEPNNSVAYNNLGSALQDLGRLEEAIKAYNKALSIKPDYAEVHSRLSFIKKYKKDDCHINQVEKLYENEDVSKNEKCQLCFALAKMYEDIGDYEKSFSFLMEGNSLRKKILSYSINRDLELFTRLKKQQIKLLRNSLRIKPGSIEVLPVFILGMPRSGTTLVEQILSSHSEVIGAGELSYVSHLGKDLAINSSIINNEAIFKFRKRYISEISKISNKKTFLTDKMPHNFRFIPLICAAFPEAKIIHVQRNAAATCWSNYKQYFPSDSLGYCYDLSDVVEYYTLYKDLMKLWQSHYGDRIYNLNYESLTTAQEKETRKLIKHLGLDWEDACISPHKNKRTVKTASQQQVKQKVYKGSSEAWRKYEPFLNGAFDILHSS